MKTVICNNCDTEINKGEKVCPHCGEKTKKPVYKRIWFWILVVIATFIALAIIANVLVPTYSVEDKPVTLDLNNMGTCEGVYTGEMDDELPEGEGTFICTSDNGGEWSYSGTWKNGQMTGYGTYAYSDGHSVYEGEIQDGLKHGKGTILYDDTKWIEGTFQEDVLVEGNQYNHKGEIVYSGTYENGNPSNADALKKYAKAVPYSDLERNPDDYKDDIIVFKGKVVQVIEGGEATTLKIDVDGDSAKPLLAAYDRNEGDSRILENDDLTFYGNYYNMRSYTDLIDMQHTVPGITLYYFEK